MVNCEKYLLSKQDYRLNVPTPQEFVNILLKLANPDEDLSQLAELAAQTTQECFKSKKTIIVF